MILTNGKLNVLQLLAGNVAGKKIASIAVGTSGTAVTAADTAITGMVTAVVTLIEYLPGNVERYTAVLPASVPAMIIAEMGLLNDAGILMHRKVLAASFTKAVGLAYTLKYEVKVV